MADGQFAGLERVLGTLTDKEKQVVSRIRHDNLVAEQKARDMVAAEEEARQRGCRKERRRKERRRKQLVKDRQEILAARKRDKENKIAWNRVHDGPCTNQGSGLRRGLGSTVKICHLF